MRAIRLKPVYYPHLHAHRYAILLMWLVNFFQTRLNKNLNDLPPKYVSDYSRAVEDVFHSLPILTFSIDEARKFVQLLARYHNQHYFGALKKAVGVDVQSLFSPKLLEVTLEQAIQKNVALIRSIPAQLRTQIEQVISESITKTGFHHGRLSDFLNQEITEELSGRFLVAKTRAKLIARDQTNKTIAAMSEACNRQIGITDYIWLGVDDERERPAHVANNGKRFSYDNRTRVKLAAFWDHP